VFSDLRTSAENELAYTIFVSLKYLLTGQQTERLSFREISNADFPAWLEFFKHPAAFEHWKAEVESPQRECEKWYEKQFHRYTNDLGGMNALIDKQTGKLIGHCGLLVQTVDETTELEIGYSLLPAFWDKGFASEAAKKCRDFAFENNFADSLISIISVTNAPSQGVAIKNGMRIDKLTNYRGNKVIIYRVNKSDPYR
jgi:[ribosomal protein S5]-alanine N-acetyltransferase